MKILQPLTALFLLITAFSVTCYAQSESRPETIAPDSKAEPDEDEVKYIYETPTMEKLSQLYWALDMLDINNDRYIDNFLMLNECDIYKDYINHEFKWKKIREDARDFIRNNKSGFSLRFEVVQPLRLGEYDFEKQSFDIIDKYKIKGVGRFEVYAEDVYDSLCGSRSDGKIEGYPRALIVEFSRPVQLESIPVSPEKADKYISEKLNRFKDLSESRQMTYDLYDYRKAYLVMKIKIFANRGEIKAAQGLQFADMFAVLEGIDVYADYNRENLLYSENYRQRKKMSAMEAALKREHEQRKKMEQQQLQINPGSEPQNKKQN